MFGLGISELIIIAVIVLLIFGARRLPEIGQELGKTVKEVKNISKERKGRVGKKESPEKRKSDDNREGPPSPSTSLKDEIESIPGVEEIKTVKKTASQVRKWWWLLKH